MTDKVQTGAAILDIKNATVFRKHNKVFNNLSLELKSGESTAILGPNGAGKTTFLKLLTRELYPVVKPDSHLRIFGNDRVNIWQLRERIGVVSHEFQSAYETLATGLDVVISAWFGSVGLHAHNQVSAAHITQARDLMEELRISDLQEKPFLHLSTGQQRRLLLARALMHQPEVLIFDEPTNGLDMSAGFQLLNDIRKFCKRGVTLILVTHHIQEIIPEIERVIFLKNGEVVGDGKKEQQVSSKNISRLYDYPIQVNLQNGYYTANPA